MKQSVKKAALIVGGVGWVFCSVGCAWALIVDAHATTGGAIAAIGGCLVLAAIPGLLAWI